MERGRSLWESEPVIVPLAVPGETWNEGRAGACIGASGAGEPVGLFPGFRKLYTHFKRVAYCPWRTTEEPR